MYAAAAITTITDAVATSRPRSQGVGPRYSDARVSAAANSLAVANLSAGVLASARTMAPATAGGTVSRTILSPGTGSIDLRAMIACGVGPPNGGAPASIS